MPIIYSASQPPAPESVPTSPPSPDPDSSIALSDLLSAGETSRLRRRGAVRLDHGLAHAAEGSALGHESEAPNASDSSESMNNVHRLFCRTCEPTQISRLSNYSYPEQRTLLHTHSVSHRSHLSNTFNRPTSENHLSAFFARLKRERACFEEEEEEDKEETTVSGITYRNGRERVADEKDSDKLWVAYPRPVDGAVLPLPAEYLKGGRPSKTSGFNDRHARTQLCTCTRTQEFVACATCGTPLGTRFRPCATASVALASLSNLFPRADWNTRHPTSALAHYITVPQDVADALARIRSNRTNASNPNSNSNLSASVNSHESSAGPSALPSSDPPTSFSRSEPPRWMPPGSYPRRQLAAAVAQRSAPSLSRASRLRNETRQTTGDFTSSNSDLQDTLAGIADPAQPPLTDVPPSSSETTPSSSSPVRRPPGRNEHRRQTVAPRAAMRTPFHERLVDHARTDDILVLSSDSEDSESDGDEDPEIELSSAGLVRRRVVRARDNDIDNDNRPVNDNSEDDSDDDGWGLGLDENVNVEPRYRYRVPVIREGVDHWNDPNDDYSQSQGQSHSSSPGHASHSHTTADRVGTGTGAGAGQEYVYVFFPSAVVGEPLPRPCAPAPAPVAGARAGAAASLSSLLGESESAEAAYWRSLDARVTHAHARM